MNNGSELSSSETRIQQEIVMWFWNTFPEMRGGLCYNLNNSVGGFRGKLNRFLGIIAGRSDMTLYHQGKAYMIELKTEKGSQSPTQKKWQSFIENQGFNYVIIRSLEEFKQFVGVVGIGGVGCGRCKQPFTKEELEVNEHCFNCGLEIVGKKRK